MPKSKSPKVRQPESSAQQAASVCPPHQVSQSPADEDLELESFGEPAWLAGDSATGEDPDLEAPAWLEASSAAVEQVPVLLASPAGGDASLIEEPEDSLFLSSDNKTHEASLADLATMENAVRRADLGSPALPESEAPLMFDEFPDEPEWAASTGTVVQEESLQPETAPSAQSQAIEEAAAQRAEATLQSIVDRIDDRMAKGSGFETIDEGLPHLETRPETDTTQHVVFYLGASRYSLPIEAVTEVSTVPRITLLPGIPHYVRGVANLRGEILPVLDMRGLLGLTRISNAVLERMLVVRFAEQDAVVGLVVDRVRGLARLDQTRIAHPQGLADDAVLRFIEGVTEHENEVLNVLNTRKIFLSEEVRRLSGI